MTSDSNRAGASEHLCSALLCSTYEGFHLNKNHVDSTLRQRSLSSSTTSSNDPSRFASGPSMWDEDILNLLGDFEGSKLFKKHLERHQMGHYHRFYHFCNNFKKRVEELAHTVKLRRMIELAFENYITVGRHLSIQCLDSDVRTAIAEKMAGDTIDITMFDAAQQQVLDFLRQTSYKSFFESDAYLKSDIYLDFIDYKEHQKSAGMMRRQQKINHLASLHMEVEDFQKYKKKEIFYYTLARKEPAKYFTEIKQKLLSSISNSAICSKIPNDSQHQLPQNSSEESKCTNLPGTQKLNNTLLRPSTLSRESKEQDPKENSSTTPRMELKDNSANQHQSCRNIDPNRGDEKILPGHRSSACHGESSRKEGEHEKFTQLKVWHFGPDTVTHQATNYKQHLSSHNQDKECSDQSILDEHCSKVFDKSPSPPKDRKKEKTKDSMSWGVDCNKFQAGYKLPSWQEYSSAAGTDAHARWYPKAKSNFSLNSIGDSGVGHASDEYASLIGQSSAGAMLNAKWLPNTKSTFSLNSRGDSGVGYTTDEYASVTYRSASSLTASQSISHHASTLARPLPSLPDGQAVTNQRSAATLPRSMNKGTVPMSQHHSTTPNHASKPSWNWSGGGQQARPDKGMQAPHQGNTVALKLIYSFPDDKKVTPYLVGLDLPRGYHPTLEDVKKQCPRKGQLYRYFFKTVIHGMEVLKEECSNTAAVPMLNGSGLFIECRAPRGG